MTIHKVLQAFGELAEWMQENISRNSANAVMFAFTSDSKAREESTLDEVIREIDEMPESILLTFRKFKKSNLNGTYYVRYMRYHLDIINALILRKKPLRGSQKMKLSASCIDLASAALAILLLNHKGEYLQHPTSLQVYISMCEEMKSKAHELLSDSAHIYCPEKHFRNFLKAYEKGKSGDLCALSRAAKAIIQIATEAIIIKNAL